MFEFKQCNLEIINFESQFKSRGCFKKTQSKLFIEINNNVISSFIIDNIFKHQTFKSYLVTIDHIAFILNTNLL